MIQWVVKDMREIKIFLESNENKKQQRQGQKESF
jgi:hypothetical protein